MQVHCSAETYVVEWAMSGTAKTSCFTDEWWYLHDISWKAIENLVLHVRLGRFTIWLLVWCAQLSTAPFLLPCQLFLPVRVLGENSIKLIKSVWQWKENFTKILLSLSLATPNYVVTWWGITKISMSASVTVSLTSGHATCRKNVEQI